MLASKHQQSDALKYLADSYLEIVSAQSGDVVQSRGKTGVIRLHSTLDHKAVKI